MNWVPKVDYIDEEYITRTASTKKYWDKNTGTWNEVKIYRIPHTRAGETWLRENIGPPTRDVVGDKSWTVAFDKIIMIDKIYTVYCLAL